MQFSVILKKRYFFHYSYKCNIMAKGYRFMPLGLVRLRTVRLSARVELTCHSEMSQEPSWETGLQSVGDVTHRKRAEDFGDFEKVR